MIINRKNQQTKRCSECGEIKTLDCFYKDKRKKGGLYCHCKECICAYRRNRFKNNPAARDSMIQQNKKWAKKNIIQMIGYRRDYRKKNHDILLDYNREWQKENYKKNKRIVLAKQKIWRDNNREKLKKQAKEWRRNNPDKYPIYRRSYYLKNKDIFRIKTKEYQKNNRIKLLAASRILYQRHRDELSDSYMKKILVTDTSLKYKDIPPELIEAKRLYLQVQRTIKELI